MVVGKSSNLSFSFWITNPLSPNSIAEFTLPEGIAYKFGSNPTCLINGVSTSCTFSVLTGTRGEYYSKISVVLPCVGFCTSYTTISGEI